jgi:hypothetical protein
VLLAGPVRRPLIPTLESRLASAWQRLRKTPFMSNVDFGDLRFVVLVIAAFLLGIASSLTHLHAALPG